MTDPARGEILVITTHYPYGTIQENWIAPELVEFSRRFSKVHILPIKELNGSRDLPEGTELWAPLAGLNRKAFFARQALRPTTWRYFMSAMRECAAGPSLTYNRTIVNFKFACYRAALEAMAQLDRFLATPGPKLVYAYWGHIAALAIPKAHSRGAVTCVRFHASDLYVHRPETGGFYPWRRELRAVTDLNAFISEHGRQYFFRNDGEPNLQSATVCRLGSRDYGLPMVRTLPERRIVMVSASWIDPIKRVEEIARLAGALARSRSLVWHHFGGGQMDVVDQAVAAARAAGAEVILHGIVPVEYLQRFYREIDVTVFVNLSRDEGIPVSIMEAMNADIPTVATNVGGTAEVVIEGRSGMLVEPDLKVGPEVLARRVLAALEPGGALATAQPRQVWQELCDGEALATAFAERLQQLSKRRSLKFLTSANTAGDDEG
jgi:colanic acid/amylovoran biosynthesis glycosyltransferase